MHVKGIASFSIRSTRSSFTCAPERSIDVMKRPSSRNPMSEGAFCESVSCLGSSLNFLSMRESKLKVALERESEPKQLTLSQKAPSDMGFRESVSCLGSSLNFLSMRESKLKVALERESGMMCNATFSFDSLMDKKFKEEPK